VTRSVLWLARPGESKYVAILHNCLVQAVLLGHGKGPPSSNLINHPALFPFEVQMMVRDLISNPAFRSQRQGDQSDFGIAIGSLERFS
jgi:hypothetical protein